ncbi:hypothetical protein Sjap_022291 [Stephania japonica]|uniref:Uncharacterized protein n=1 Tax=Stephania japonica TaxID=461633 RepID=A0AAP0HSP1_9MAGN
MASVGFNMARVHVMREKQKEKNMNKKREAMGGDQNMGSANSGSSAMAVTKKIHPRSDLFTDSSVTEGSKGSTTTSIGQ